MEECEALCDRLGIMLNGQLQCLGTITDIKNKYGGGWRLLVKCHHSDQLDSVILNLDNFIKSNFPTAFLEDRQYETLFYLIKPENNEEQSLSKIFSLIEKNKDFLKIESYFISETTLEQVFMSFANKSLSLVNSINKTKYNRDTANDSNLANKYGQKKLNVDLLSYKKIFNKNHDQIYL